MSRRKRTYTTEFKLEVVRRVLEDGETPLQVGTALEFDHNLIYSWLERFEAGTLSPMPPRPPIPDDMPDED